MKTSFERANNRKLSRFENEDFEIPQEILTKIIETNLKLREERNKTKMELENLKPNKGVKRTRTMTETAKDNFDKTKPTESMIDKFLKECREETETTNQPNNEKQLNKNTVKAHFKKHTFSSSCLNLGANARPQFQTI